MKKFLYFFSSLRTPLFSLLFILGCENPPEGYQPEPNVVCLLRTDQDTVLALVGLSAGFTDTLKNQSQWNGVSGATVTIDSVSLREWNDSIGYYLTDSLKPTAGKIYALEVLYPNEQTVTGTTTVPDSFAIISVSIDTVTDTIIFFPHDTIIEDIARVIFSWEKSNNGRGYLISGECHYTGGNDSMAFPIDPFLQDSTSDSLKIPIEMWSQSGDILNLVETKISIWALDENYYDYSTYLQTGWFDPNADIPQHLDGGLGVFGSAYVVERIIIFSP